MIICLLLAQNILQMIHIENYINGELVKPTLNQYIDNVDPSRGEVYSQIPSSTKE